MSVFSFLQNAIQGSPVGAGISAAKGAYAGSQPVRNFASGVAQSIASSFSPSVASAGDYAYGPSLPGHARPVSVAPSQRQAQASFAQSGPSGTAATIGRTAAQFAISANPIARSVQLGNSLASAQSPTDAAQAVGNFGLQSLTGINKVSALDRLSSPTARLAAYSVLRGGENAAVGQGSSLVSTGRLDASRAAGDFALGAASNVVASPRLAMGAVRQAGKPLSRMGDVANQENIANAVRTLHAQVPQEPVQAPVSFNGERVPVTRDAPTVTLKVDEKNAASILKKGEASPNTAVINHAGTDQLPKVTIRLDPQTGKVVSWAPERSQFAERFVNSPYAPKSEFADALNGGKTAQPASPDWKPNMEGAQFRSSPNTAGDLNLPDVPLQKEMPPNMGTGSNLKEKSFSKAAETSPALSPATRDLAYSTDSTYTPRKNSELSATASSQVDAMGLDAAKAHAMNASDITDEGVARAIEVAKRLDASGQSAEANQVIQANAERALQAGRAVQANRLLERFSPQGIKAQLANLAVSNGRKLPDGTVVPVKVSDEVFNHAAQMMTDAVRSPEGRARNLAIQKAQEYIHQQFPSSIVDQALSVWQAGLLTGLKTTGVNMLANTGHAVLRKFSDVPTSLVDAATSLFTGNRATTFTMRGIGKGVSSGSKEAIDYLIHGYDPGKSGSKYEAGTVFANNPVGRLAKTYSQTIQRFIGGQDRPFSKAAFFNSIADQAGAEAKRMGLSGKAYGDHIEMRLRDPGSEIGQRAAQEADQSVFANDTMAGDVAKKLQDTKVGKALVPFAKTPSAVVGSVFSYTPIGSVYDLGKMIAARSFDQRTFSQALGKGITGTALLWLGTELAKAGIVNTTYPTGSRDKELWKAENRQENSIVLPSGRQIQAQSLGPAGSLLIAGAAMQQAREQGHDPFSALPAQIGGTALQSPALQGVQGFTQALQDPVRYGETFTNSLAGSVVPTLVGDVAQAGDRAPNGQGVSRQTNSNADAVTNKIPGLRERNAQAVDSLGNQRTTGKDLFQTLADPTRSVTLSRSPLVDYLRQMGDSGYDVMPTPIDKTVTQFGYKLGIDKATQTRLQQEAGQRTQAAYGAYLSNPSFSQQDPSAQQRILTGVASTIRGQVEKDYMRGLGTDAIVAAGGVPSSSGVSLSAPSSTSLTGRSPVTGRSTAFSGAKIPGQTSSRARSSRPARIASPISVPRASRTLSLSNAGGKLTPKLPGVKRIAAPGTGAKPKRLSLGAKPGARSRKSLRS